MPGIAKIVEHLSKHGAYLHSTSLTRLRHGIGLGYRSLGIEIKKAPRAAFLYVEVAMRCPIKCNTRWSTLPAVSSQWGLQSPNIAKASTDLHALLERKWNLVPQHEPQGSLLPRGGALLFEERASTRERDPGAMHKSRLGAGIPSQGALQ